MNDSWWVASLGKTLVWARLRMLESGTAAASDCDGRTLTYDSEDRELAALRAAEFRAWDGLDEDDARALGFALEAVQPPKAQDDEALRQHMFQPLPTVQ